MYQTEFMDIANFSSAQKEANRKHLEALKQAEADKWAFVELTNRNYDQIHSEPAQVAKPEQKKEHIWIMRDSEMLICILAAFAAGMMITLFYGLGIL